eukprot:1113939-Amphidinium_carterae.1
MTPGGRQGKEDSSAAREIANFEREVEEKLLLTIVHLTRNGACIKFTLLGWTPVLAQHLSVQTCLPLL